jgi:hypothetical protein
MATSSNHGQMSVADWGVMVDTLLATPGVVGIMEARPVTLPDKANVRLTRSRGGRLEFGTKGSTRRGPET